MASRSGALAARHQDRLSVAAPLRLLVVDDEKSWLEVVEIAAELAQGIEVETAQDAVHGLAAAIRHTECGEPFDAIVTDLKLVGYDGTRLIEQMRTDRKLARTPIVVVSAYLSDLAKGILSSMGVATLDKGSVSPADLFQFVAQLVQQRREEIPCLVS